MRTSKQVFVAGYTTYYAFFSIVIPGKWVKRSDLHPSSAKFFCDIFEETTNICSDLKIKPECIVCLAHCASNLYQRVSKDRVAEIFFSIHP